MAESNHLGKLPTEKDFWAFAATIPIASRDTGFGPVDPWGTQRHLIHEIFSGLKDGIHQFIVLKAGQVGASLILQLLTLFWYRHSEGLQGVCVADSDEVREFFRDQFTLMGQNAPEPETFRVNNRNQVAWENGSRLLFQTSGVRTGSRLGIGRGVAFIHGTEVPLWQNPSSITYLRTRFSDKHPHRLGIWEGTARGRNWFFDMWEDSEDAVDVRRIFLGWWLREEYTVDKESPQFKQYWDKRLSRTEAQWAVSLKSRYKVELTPEQWAWRRWYVKEKAGGNERLADQEMPTLPEHAFEATGESFLGQELVSRIRKSLRTATKPKTYRYEFATRLEDGRVVPTIPALADLLVWEEPQAAEAYVIAAVFAHSSNAKCATSVVSIFRATRDTLDQVAEFSSTTVGLQTFSWVVAHLLGVYQVPYRGFICEIAGPGMGVLQELKRLSQSGWGTRVSNAQIRKTMGPLSHYLWRRSDSLGGGLALQWKTQGELQTWLLRRLKDQLESGAVNVRSEELLSELERMRQVDDEFESDGKTVEEHRLMGAALAVESWVVQVRPLFRRVQGRPGADTVMGRTIESFFKQLARSG